MKKLNFLLIVFICISTAYAQTPTESMKFLKETFHQPNIGKTELLSKFNHYDFSGVWMRYENHILGFIDSNYQRLYIRYLLIIKDAENANKYYVYGKSKVKSNICQFMGEIELIHVRKFNDTLRQQFYEEAKKHHDKNAMMRSSKPEYMLLARYQFFENPKHYGSGTFKGILRSNFYLSNGTVFYYDLDRGVSDGFSNNQCVGTWTGYESKIPKEANWGEFRIPFSGDLDIGAGDFSPNEKYLKYGWESYYKAMMIGTREAWKEEEKKWW